MEKSIRQQSSRDVPGGAADDERAFRRDVDEQSLKDQGPLTVVFAASTHEANRALIDESLRMVRVDGRQVNVAETHQVSEAGMSLETQLHEAAAFVVDLSAVELQRPVDGASPSQIPNPDGLIALGFALRVLEPERVIALQNTALGMPISQSVLDGQVVAIPFAFPDDADQELRNDVQRLLCQVLQDALVRAIGLEIPGWDRPVLPAESLR